MSSSCERAVFRLSTALLALLVLVGCSYIRTDHDALLRPQTDDGVTLLLRHYAPQNPDPQKSPVLLVHGMGASGLNFALPGRSLAEYLRDRGYNCFVAELRGDRLSEPAPGKGRYDFNLDDHILRDMPALVEAIRERTGAEQINMIGHSMGGVIIGCYLAYFGDERARSVVIVASPFAYRRNTLVYQWAARHLRLLQRLPTFPMAGPMPWLARVLESTDSLIELFLYNPQNIDGPTLRAFSRGGLSATPAKVLSQFAQNMADGSNTSWDRSFDYSARLAGLTVPSLWIAGKRDEIVQPVNVRLSYELAGGEDKSYVLAGRANGFSVDYGHGDLILGDSAPREIYPLIEGWMARRQR
ncbi:MAG: alpha/beta fold hydrolase [Candidatus Alcyoniella australis]|nr:alpha/beta fold hydrolase [Candidatus Alcyoniella australis]